MKKNAKKGFTLVELLVVIAILAILATVSIVGYTAFIEKANRSADETAVTQMNTVLQAEEISNKLDIYEVFDCLAEAGLDAEDYKALSKNMSFFYDAEINTVLIVDKNGVAVYPKAYEGRTNTKQTWRALTQKIETVETAINSGVTSVDNGGKLAYVVEQANKNVPVSEITLNGVVDMMGSNLTVDKVSNNLTVSGGTIKNATAVEAKTTTGKTEEGQDGVYNTALFPKVAGQLHLKNIVIENLNIKDTNASNAGLLVGTVAKNATLIIENVTIKNSKIIGHHNVGALVGINYGTIKIVGKVTLENVEVQCVGGRVGQLVGHYSSGSVISEADINGVAAAISMTNVKTGIFSCEANTGTFDGVKLGLTANGSKVASTEIEGNGVKTVHEGREYFENTLVGNLSNTTVAPAEGATNAQIFYTAFKGLVA